MNKMAALFSGRSVRLAVKSKTWNPTQTEWKHAAQCVQQEEKERIGKFIFKKDAKSAMVGRLLMRYAVAQMLNIPYRALKFDRTEKGKPFLVSPIDKCTPRCDVNFNISHQGEYVVFAGETGRGVGVDIMNIEWPRNRPISEFLESMDKQLTSQEWLEVKSCEGDMEQLRIFYRFWCLKESFVKALGIGIGFQVNRLNFRTKTASLSPDRVTCDTQVDIDDELATEWYFEESIIEDHGVAVAINTQNNGDTTAACNISNGKEESTLFTVMDIQDVLLSCQSLTGTETDMEYWKEFSCREEEPRLR